MINSKCRACGASTDLTRHTLIGHHGRLTPAEIRLCRGCKSVAVFAASIQPRPESAAQEETIRRTDCLGVEKEDSIIEVFCPCCGESMFYVQHVDAIVGGRATLAESWTCQCGTCVDVIVDDRTG